MSNKYNICLAQKSPVDTRDWVLESILNYKGELPLILDLRQDLQPVRNQGIYGTCAAMTAACIKEYQEKKDIKISTYFSPIFIYLNRENNTTEGMYPRDVMRILSNLGACEEKYLPYNKFNNKTTKSIIQKQSLTNALNYKIKGYSTISTIDGLKKALYLYGPCLIAFPVYNYTMKMWHKSSNEQLIGGHAMTVVGYNKTSFIIRNSWGISWGDKGYTYYDFNEFGAHWELWTVVDAATKVNKNKQIKSKLELINKNNLIKRNIARKQAELRKKKQQDKLKSRISRIIKK
jgi:C1A family cysteine protease